MLPRYIDADKFEVFHATVPFGYDMDSFIAGTDAVLEAIDEAQTVNVREVILCRDCKFRQKTFCRRQTRLNTVYTTPNDFCSHAERKQT